MILGILGDCSELALYCCGLKACLVIGLMVYYVCRAAEEGRSVLASNSSSLAPLQAIINKLMAACGDLANGNTEKTAHRDVAMDPLLGSRIHLGF